MNGVLERTLGILEYLAAQAEATPLTLLADELEIPRSACHRLLTDLVRCGYVRQIRGHGDYVLTTKLVGLGLSYLATSGIVDVAQATLDRLADISGELVRLAIVDGDRLTWVAKSQGAKKGLRYDPDMGQEIVLHATANGKAWLSTLPENEALRIVCARGFGAHRTLGPRAVGEVDELRRHLNETRARGYAIAVDEAEPGTAAIAVPFRADTAPGAAVVGTISIAGPLMRITPDRYDDLSRELYATADEVSAVWQTRIRQRGGARSNGSQGRPMVTA